MIALVVLSLWWTAGIIPIGYQFWRHAKGLCRVPRCQFEATPELFLFMMVVAFFAGPLAWLPKKR